MSSKRGVVQKGCGAKGGRASKGGCKGRAEQEAASHRRHWVVERLKCCQCPSHSAPSTTSMVKKGGSAPAAADAEAAATPPSVALPSRALRAIVIIWLAARKEPSRSLRCHAGVVASLTTSLAHLAPDGTTAGGVSAAPSMALSAAESAVERLERPTLRAEAEAAGSRTMARPPSAASLGSSSSKPICRGRSEGDRREIGGRSKEIRGVPEGDASSSQPLCNQRPPAAADGARRWHHLQGTLEQAARRHGLLDRHIVDLSTTRQSVDIQRGARRGRSARRGAAHRVQSPSLAQYSAAVPPMMRAREKTCSAREGSRTTETTCSLQPGPK